VYTYGTLGGAVFFYAEDMPNPDVWRAKNDVRSFSYDACADHVCTYLCWTAPVGGGGRHDDHDDMSRTR
jgi:hypothetical protein